MLVWGCCQFSARSEKGRKHRQTVEFVLRGGVGCPGEKGQGGGEVPVAGNEKQLSGQR